MRIISFLILSLLSTAMAQASESLSYSGRLVNSDGSPVSGPVNLKFDLAYSNDPTNIICFKTVNAIPLSNGVFHAKIDFDATDCSGASLPTVLLATPVNQSAVIRVVDVTNSKTYSFQAFHTMPYSLIANMAKTLAPLPASDIGKVLQWDGSTWIPATLGTGSGSVTNVATGTGLTGGPITTTGTISIANSGVGTTQIADGAVTDAKIAGVARSKLAAGSANHVIVNDGAGNLASLALLGITQGGTGANSAAGARTNLGLGTAATADVAYASGSVMPGFAIPTCVPGYKLHFTGVGPTWWSCITEDGGDASKLPLAGGTMSGNIAMGGTKVTGLGAPTAGSDAATKTYVDAQIASESLWALNGSDVSRGSGNVGIGVALPSAALHINRASGVAGDILLTNTSNNWTLKTGTTDNSFSIVDNQWGPRLFISPSGDMGIGTTTPTINNAGRVLHIHESATNAVGIHLTNGTTGAGPAQGFFVGRWVDGSYANGPIIWNYANTPMTFGTNAVERMVISANGNVGIGESNPSAGLQLRAGTATSAPLKLMSGTNLTTPQAGAIEFDGSNLFYTNSSNIRKALATSTGATTIQPAAGSAASPSYAFDADTDTGFYSAGADTIGVAAGGASLFTFGANGLTSSTAGGGHVGSATGSATQPTFSFAGDTDTGWYSPLVDNLAASTAGTERVRITQQGRVGIGVSAPAAQLSVRTSTAAQLHLSGGNLDPAGSPDFTFLNGDGDLLIGTNRQAGSVQTDFINGRHGIYGGGFQFHDYNKTTGVLTPRVTFQGSTGFVGIGTDVPGVNLHVVSGADNGTGIRIDNTATGGRTYGIRSTGPTSAGGAGLLKITDAAAGDRLVINSSGHVGVGTNAPDTRLHVANGDASFAKFGPNTTWGATLVTGAGPSQILNKQGQVIVTDGNLHLDSGVGQQTYVNYYSAGNVYIANAGGKVGIGTTAPAGKLEIKGPADDSIHLYVGDSNTVNSKNLYFSRYGGPTAPMGIQGTKAGVGAEHIVLQPQSGNVGIGTSSPAAKLQVNGDLFVGVDDGSDTATYGSYLNFLGATQNGDPLFMRRYNISPDKSELRVNIGDDMQQEDAFNIGTNFYVDSAWHSHLKVQANGNVGVGKELATAKLHLAAGAADPSKAPLKFTQGINTTTPEPGAVEYDGNNLYFTNQSSVRQTIATSSAAGNFAASSSVTTPAVYGSSAATSNLTLDSTSNASKGNVLIAPSGGNVGIGVSSPNGMLSNSSSSRLDENLNGLGTMALNWTGVSSGYVAGFENFATGGLGHGVLIRTADTSPTARALNVITGGTPRFRVMGSGKVGVGVNDPENLFTVTGPAVNVAATSAHNNQSQLLIRGTGTTRDSSLGAALGFMVPADTDGTNQWEQGRIIVTPNNATNNDAHGRMILQTRYVDATWKWRNNLTLLPNGNVGVNDTNPASSFSVVGAGGNGAGPAVLEVKATNPQAYTWATHTSASTLGANQALVNLVGKNGSTNNLAYFGYKHVADGSNQNKMTFGMFNVDDIMTMNASRNIGINDTSPRASLSVGGPNGAFISAHTVADSGYLAGAFGSGMHWDGSSWVSRGDGGSNGGALMAATKGGQLKFFVTPNTSGSDASITDANLETYKMMTLGYDNSLTMNGAVFARGGHPGDNNGNRTGYAFSSPGDTDSGMFSLADNMVNFYLDGQEFVRLNERKMGINTTAPTEAFDVNGSAHVKNLSLGYSDNSHRGAIYFSSTNDSNHRLYNNYTNLDGEGMFDGIKWNVYEGLRIRTNTGGSTEALRVLIDGKIGMGVTAPSEKLEVAGNVKADAFLYNSDARLKKNISTIQNPLEKIMKLRGVNFTWKSSNEKTVGFVAQEVERVVPELVKTSPTTSLKSVQYSNIVAIIVEAIKELRGQNSREVATLKEENRKLRTKVETLEQRLDRLEQRSASR
jgi:hypothetical protein